MINAFSSYNTDSINSHDLFTGDFDDWSPSSDSLTVGGKCNRSVSYSDDNYTDDIDYDNNDSESYGYVENIYGGDNLDQDLDSIEDIIDVIADNSNTAEEDDDMDDLLSIVGISSQSGGSLYNDNDSDLSGDKLQCKCSGGCPCKSDVGVCKHNCIESQSINGGCHCSGHSPNAQPPFHLQNETISFSDYFVKMSEDVTNIII